MRAKIFAFNALTIVSLLSRDVKGCTQVIYFVFKNLSDRITLESDHMGGLIICTLRGNNAMSSSLLRLFRQPALPSQTTELVRRAAENRLQMPIEQMKTEWSYLIETATPLNDEQLGALKWLITETFEPANTREDTFLAQYATIADVGPRLNFETAYSTIARKICHACGIPQINRLEICTRFGLSAELSPRQLTKFAAPLHDKMTQQLYRSPLNSLTSNRKPKPAEVIDIIGQGKSLLEKFNAVYGCTWDAYDIDWVYDLFKNVLKVNPTDVVLFQIAQTITAEHSRHGYFKGRHIIDGQEEPESLMQIVKAAWKAKPGNSRIAFDDDSSSIKGHMVEILIPMFADRPGPMIRVRRFYNPTSTFETHNHPTFVEPFEGAATGTGGRQRDNWAVGRGGLTIAGIFGIFTDNLCIPEDMQPWEDDAHLWKMNKTGAPALQIMLRGSDGALSYGNCQGEPTIAGVTRTFGMTTPDGRRGWGKPILYTGGLGHMDDDHVGKHEPKPGDYVLLYGGRNFRIGLGGGATSSAIAGGVKRKLANDSVQRGDPERAQCISRFTYAMVSLGKANVIITKRDIGAGGNGNTGLEIGSPYGVEYDIINFPLGDTSLSPREILSNESQERMMVVIAPEDWPLAQRIAERERVECVIAGIISGDGWFTLVDSRDNTTLARLPYDEALENLPRKTFCDTTIRPTLHPLVLPDDLTLSIALKRIMRLLSVGSKRCFTNKVDRSVTGRVAQQQCVGPNQLALSDYGAVAHSVFKINGKTPGEAVALGEQPIVSLLSPAAGIRMAFLEALFNIVGAKLQGLDRIRFSGNWMAPGKEPGEAANIFQAAKAMRDITIHYEVAEDGGKDSLSMVVVMKGPDGKEYRVKAPMQFIYALYAAMDDVENKITCEAKNAGDTLIFIDMSGGKNRLGGSALGQVYKQLGDECPDIEDFDLPIAVWNEIQLMVDQKLINAVHDRGTDGGLGLCLMEMVFPSNLGLSVDLKGTDSEIACYLSQEAGVVIATSDPTIVIERLRAQGIPHQIMGKTTKRRTITMRHNSKLVLRESLLEMRSIWQKTSDVLELRQANPKCIEQEIRTNTSLVTPPPCKLTFTPTVSLKTSWRPRVAVLREEGTNGDHELKAILDDVGFKPYDVAMSDLLAGTITLDEFQGVCPAGGFSFKDVFDAGKGQAGVIRFNPRLRDQAYKFRHRPDTFGFGPCNGCQFTSLLGWLSEGDTPDVDLPRFIRNESGRFESRWVYTTILESNAIALQGMAGSTIGIWVAHGEGRFHVRNRELLDNVLTQNLAPIRYVDQHNQPTMRYPFNPNGSPHGIAGICSTDGRFLAMMPHPERAFLKWQLPWVPDEYKHLSVAPWRMMFENLYRWACQH